LPAEAQAQIHAALDANPLVTIHDYPSMDHAFARRAASTTTPPRRSSRTCARLEFLSVISRARVASAQQTLSQRWDDHVKYEFATRNTDDTLETMVSILTSITCR
jgi:carboxymethylenebutenolidase